MNFIWKHGHIEKGWTWIYPASITVLLLLPCCNTEKRQEFDHRMLKFNIAVVREAYGQPALWVGKTTFHGTSAVQKPTCYKRCRQMPKTTVGKVGWNYFALVLDKGCKTYGPETTCSPTNTHEETCGIRFFISSGSRHIMLSEQKKYDCSGPDCTGIEFTGWILLFLFCSMIV